MWKLKKSLIKGYSRLTNNNLFYRINQKLFRLSLKGMGISLSSDMDNNGEKNLIINLSKIFKSPIIFDVGANDGKYIKSLNRYFNYPEIHGFEPHPTTFSILKKDTQKHNNIIINNKGLSKKKGIFKLYDYKNKQCSEHATMYKDVFDSIWKKKYKTYKIKVTTLDSYIKERKIDHINFLKIDTEGQEYDILLGSKKAINNNKIDTIQFEFNSMNVISKIFIKDYINYLQNYYLFRLVPKGLKRIKYNTIEHEIFGYQNIIAINKKWLKKNENVRTILNIQ